MSHVWQKRLDTSCKSEEKNAPSEDAMWEFEETGSVDDRKTHPERTNRRSNGSKAAKCGEFLRRLSLMTASSTIMNAVEYYGCLHIHM